MSRRAQKPKEIYIQQKSEKVRTQKKLKISIHSHSSQSRQHRVCVMKNINFPTTCHTPKLNFVVANFYEIQNSRLSSREMNSLMSSSSVE